MNDTTSMIFCTQSTRSLPQIAISLLLAFSLQPLAQAGDASGNIAAKPVGTATRAWMTEQREGRNRAEPEPYPADRAGMALRRYESTFSGSSDSSSATRSGTAIGIRSGSTNSAGSAGSVPGMTR